MTAYLSKLKSSLPLAAVIPVAGAVVAALSILAMPQSVLEGAVMQSGIPALLPAAAPPLGASARAALALIAATLVAGVLVAAISRFARFGKSAKKPVKRRRADAHPDAPPREPLRVSRDLDGAFSAGFAAGDESAQSILLKPGHIDDDMAEEAPLPMSARDEDQAERLPTMIRETVHGLRREADIPADLDQRLVDYDPDALPETPRERVASVEPLHRPQTFEAGERFETFELTPPVRMVSPTPAPASAPIPASPARRRDARAGHAPIAAPETDASVIALLERLERGVARRARTSARPSQKQGGTSGQGLNSTLDDLRRMAVGG